MLTVAGIVGLLALGYLLGGIPTAVVVGRRVGGIDIRRHGSGNAGAANVLRLLGWWPALGVLLVDAGKGWLAVTLVAVATTDPPWLPQAAGLAAIAGHVWPVFAKFRGGKGVATAGGVMLALYPLPLAVSVVVFVVLVAATRRVAVGSLAGAATLPVALWILQRPLVGLDLGFSVLVALVILFCHRTNVRNLLRGTEPRIGSTVEL